MLIEWGKFTKKLNIFLFKYCYFTFSYLITKAFFVKLHVELIGKVTLNYFTYFNTYLLSVLSAKSPSRPGLFYYLSFKCPTVLGEKEKEREGGRGVDGCVIDRLAMRWYVRE